MPAAPATAAAPVMRRERRRGARRPHSARRGARRGRQGRRPEVRGEIVRGGVERRQRRRRCGSGRRPRRAVRGGELRAPPPAPPAPAPAIEAVFGLRRLHGLALRLLPRAAPMMAVAVRTAAPAQRRRDALAAAEVAATARRGVGVAEVAPERDAPTALLVGILDHRPQPARILAAEDLEARTQRLDALDERLEGNRRVHAPAVHPLADAGLDEHGHQRARRALLYAGGERELLAVGVALFARPGGERPPEAPEQRRRQPREREQVLLDLQVRLVEEKDALRAVAVAPGAPRLLEVALERCGRLVVDDVADVRLVYAEAEAARRDHDDALA